MKTTVSALLAAALLASAFGAGAAPDAAPSAAHGLAPIPSDPAVMALARKALGKPCHFHPRLVGPEIADFTRLPPGVGQMPMAGGFIFIRQRGAQRVAFLAIERSEEDQCRVVDVQPLPPKAAKEAFVDCLVDNPDPKIIPPISHGLGLRQNGAKPLTSYLEADLKTGKLTSRAGDDKRIRCTVFESGD